MTRTALYQSGPWNQHWGRRAWNWLITRPWCKCGHHHDTHRHYRPGSDCGLCGCPGFRRSRR